MLEGEHSHVCVPSLSLLTEFPEVAVELCMKALQGSS